MLGFTESIVTFFWLEYKLLLSYFISLVQSPSQTAEGNKNFLTQLTDTITRTNGRTTGAASAHFTPLQQYRRTYSRDIKNKYLQRQQSPRILTIIVRAHSLSIRTCKSMLYTSRENNSTLLQNSSRNPTGSINSVASLSLSALHKTCTG